MNRQIKNSIKIEHILFNEGKQSRGNDFNWQLNHPIETKWELFNHKVSLVKSLVNHFLEDEVLKMGGPRYSRREPYSGYSAGAQVPAMSKLAVKNVHQYIQDVES